MNSPCRRESVPSLFDTSLQYLRKSSPLFNGLCREQAMAIAPVRFTSGCAAAGCAAVQPAPVAPLGSGLLARQAIPPLCPAPGCQSQAQRLSRIPFHRVDPGFRGGSPMALVSDGAYDCLPPGIDIHPLPPVLRRRQNAADEGACSRPYCRAEALRQRLGCASGQGVTFYVRHATRQHDPPCWRRGSRAA